MSWIISKEKTIFEKKRDLKRGILKKEEVSNFLKEHYRIGNILTFLPVSEIEKYERLDLLSVLLRGPNSSLVGTILSVPFPILCNSSDRKEIITHGATSFLNVHPKVRKLGLCKEIISELTLYGYEKGILCSYMVTNFPLKENSIEFESWYRPLNLQRAIAFGFSFPDWNKPNVFAKERLKFSTKMPKNYKSKEASFEKGFEFYKKINEDKKFAFYPDKELFLEFIKEYPSYLVYKEKEIVGFYSLGVIHMKTETGLETGLATPLLFNSIKGEEKNVLQSCMHDASEKGFDVLYLHSIGDITKEVLLSASAIKTFFNSYFSLYNNSMILESKDLYVPLI